MRVWAGIVALLVMLSVAHGQNPDVMIYVDFDPPERVHRADPQAYDIVTAYLMVDCMPNGFMGVCFAVWVTPEASLHTSYQNLIPEPGLVDGSYEEGMCLTSFICEMTQPLPFASVTVVYSGVPGDILLSEDPRYPRWTLDCDEPNHVDFHCIMSNGALGKDPVPTGEMCGCPSPVSTPTWGTLKSLYR